MDQMAEALQERPSVCCREQEPKTITEVVEIPSYHSTLLVPPPKVPPLSAPKPKKDPKHNPHQPPIPYPSRLQKDKSKALKNPTGRADHFVDSIDIVDSFCDKIPIQNDQSSGRTTSHYDHSLHDYKAFYFHIDLQKEKSSGSTTSYSHHSLPEYEAFYSDSDLKEFEDLLYHSPLIDPPPTFERSDSRHVEFTDKVAHIISPPDYDHFYFDIEKVLQ
ncbi:hypothetical protein Tco_1427868 [Tanacetum coccineum]